MKTFIYERCPECHGTGGEEFECSRCNGDGYIGLFSLGLLRALGLLAAIVLCLGPVWVAAWWLARS